jgi:glycosyltransferase involved in cell wall biosynthesis
MPTYNGAAFVGDTIESVLAQTYEPIELVVVDDASTDLTVAIVEGYAGEASGGIRIEQSSDRRGPCRRRNDALAVARGPLLAWLDQDDLWLPEKIARQVDVLEADPRIGVVHTAFVAFDSDTGETLEDWPDPGVGAEGDLLVPLFVQGNLVASITAVFRRAALELRGLKFRERDFSFGDDYYLWLALSLDWRFARIPDVLVRYRRHENNESHRLGQTNFHRRGIALLDEFMREFPEARERLGSARRRGLAKHYLDAANFERLAGNHLARARYVARAAALDPSGTLEAARTGRKREGS